MSAFIVEKTHINFLVHAAALLSRNTFTWYWEGRKRLEDFDPAGQLLWEENIRSVQFRYPSIPREELPGPIGESFEYVHENQLFSSKINPVAVLKAITGYSYQACETDDWKESEAHAFVESLKSLAISKLPGYEEAEWEVTEGNFDGIINILN